MSATIGQQLKQAREARSLTYLKVTQVTHIQARFLEALEADEFDSLPSPIQARAFLRIYAEYLGLSLDDLISRQRLDTGEQPIPLITTMPAPDQSPEPEELENPVASTTIKAGNDKSLRIRERIKGLILHILPVRPQPTPHPVPVKSTGQHSSSEPDHIADTQIAPVDSESDEPAENKPGTLISPDKLPSEPRKSEIIFAGIGKALQQQREALSFTLDEIENHTHVRMHYLRALEEGDFNHLPSSVQARGMLNNYAHFLDMDVDVILLKFAEGLQAQRLERQPAPVETKRIADERTSSKKKPPSGLRRYLSMDVLVGGGLVLILLVFAVWGTMHVIILRSAATPQPTAQSISDILIALPEASTSTPVPTSAAGSGTGVPIPNSTVIVTVPVTGHGPVQIVLVAIEQAFVRVTVDGKKAFDGRVAAGTAYPFDGNSQIEILTGNGAAVSILYNQSNLGPMGRIGEVVDRIYTANAILNPTATVTPTPTITPTPTMTPRYSPTPVPSKTSPTPVVTQAH